MPFLSSEDRDALKNRFEEELTSPVRVVLFTEPSNGLLVPGRRPCVSCDETEQLMNEIVELSENFRLEIHNVRQEPDVAAEWNIAVTPTISISGDEDAGVRFLGIPGGYEFISFLETLTSVSAPNFGLNDDSLQKLSSLNENVDIKTFVTPT